MSMQRMLNRLITIIKSLAKSAISLPVLLVVGLTLIARVSQAATLTWDANATTAGQTDGAAAWITDNYWWTGSANANWTSGDDAIFGNGGAGGAVTLASPMTVNSLTFNYFTGTYTLGTAGQTITLNNGVTMNAGPGAVTLTSPFSLGTAQTWLNNSSGVTLTFNGGGVNLNGNTLTLDGVGNFTAGITGAGVISGNGDLIKQGTGILTMGGAATVPIHTYSGNTYLNGGVTMFNVNLPATSSLILNGGVYEAYWNETFTRSLGSGAGKVQILGGSSGFSVNGNATLTIKLNNSTAQVIWGSDYFKPSTLVLQSDRAQANSTLDFQNAIGLNGTTRTIAVNKTSTGTGCAKISGVISTTGTAGLIKTGPGELQLTAANTYNGPTTISAGSLNLNGSGTINNSSILNLGGGTLRLVNTAQVNRFADGAAITSTGGGISYENTSGANVYTETLGSVSISGGQLNIVESTDQVGAGSQTLTLGGLSQSGSASVTFSAAGTGPQASGNKNMIVVTGAGTSSTINPWATVGTTAALQTDYANYNADYVIPSAIAVSDESTWTTPANSYTANAGLGGSVGLTAPRNITALRSISPANSVTADNTTDLITLTAHTFANGDPVIFGGTTVPAGLTAGTIYYVRDVAANVFKVAATSGGTAIDITADGTAVTATGAILVSSGNNLGTLGILNGVASTMYIAATGTGAVTLPTTSGGQLHINTGSAGITINAPIQNNTDALTLVKNGSAGNLILHGVNTYTGDTIINAGTLQIGMNKIVNGAKLGSGTYAGNIIIAVGATLYISTDANQTLSGVISGNGNLMKSYIGRLTLSGNNTYTGKTSISPTNANGGRESAGILEVYSLNSVNGGTPLLASSSLGAPTTVANGTIDLGASIQSPATLRYLGTGETSDRVVNIVFGGNTTRILDASGTGPLKFTSAFTCSTAANNITLQGSGNGEIAQGLPFAITTFIKSGSGTWTLGGAVGNTGLLTINDGKLALQKKTSLMGGNTANWTAALINVKSGATLALNVDSAEASGINSTSLDTLLTAISVTDALAAGLQAGAILALDTSTATGDTFSQGNAIANSTGTRGGTLHLIKLGTGTLVFDKTNTYTGATTINGGTLKLGDGGASGSLSASSAISVASNAVFAVNQTDTVTQGADFIGAAITGAGGFTQAGSGTTILNATNTYTGPTTVSAGTLQLGDNYAITNASQVVLAGGTLVVGNFSSVLGTLAITGNSTIELGSGNLGFADSSGGAWTNGMQLTLTGQLGATTLQFGTTSGALTAGQLAMIRYNGGSVHLDSNGYIVANPSGTVVRFR